MYSPVLLVRANTREPWHEPKLDIDLPVDDVPVKPIYGKTNTYTETLSLEDMIEEEIRFESVLHEQEIVKEEKAAAISDLKKKELHYQSEILRLEMQLEEMEKAHQPSSYSQNILQGATEDLEF